MLQDRYGLSLTTTSTDARDAYVDGVDRILAGMPDVERPLERALAAAPAFALPPAALSPRAGFLNLCSWAPRS